MKTRFPSLSLWLLVLLPVDALVVLDVWRGVVRPMIWLLLLVPALLVLSLVALSLASRSPFALRLRKELLLALPTGVLLLVSSATVFCVDVLPAGFLRVALGTLPVVMCVVLPAAAVLVPMTLERERGTLQALLTAPLGARAFVEKFALAALLVVLSWLQLTVALTRGTDLWWFAIAGHLLALATAPTWFFYAGDEGLTLGLVVISPFLLAAGPALLWVPAMLPLLGLYGVAMLALLPFAIRRGVATGAPEWMRTRAPALPWFERLAPPLRRAELRGQRDAFVFAATGAVAFVMIRLIGALGGAKFVSNDGGVIEHASLAMVALCAVAAMLSPVLAFTEARRVGTLDWELSARPRREVFARRVALSALCTGVMSVLLPVVFLMPESFSEAWHLTLALLMAMALAWTVGLAVAVHVRSVGTALALGLGVGWALLVAHVGLLIVATGVAQEALGVDRFPEQPFLVAALVVVGVTTAGVAARRFLAADRLEPRVLAAAAALSLLHAAVFGAAGVVGSLAP